MSSCKSIHLVSCVVFLFSSLTVKAKEPTFANSLCTTNTTNFTKGSEYESNLKALLSTLSLSSNSTFATGFNNSTSGRGSADVYGLFMCRGDMGADDCRDCVVVAAKDIRQLCPFPKKAIMWYDECMLRYSDVNFLGLAQSGPGKFRWKDQNISGPVSEMDFGSLGLIYKLIEVAQRSAKLYAAGKSNTTANITLYGMVQCTRDIDAAACGSCLDNLTRAADSLTRGRVGWRFNGPSCMLRYDRYPFINGSSDSEAFPPSETVYSNRKAKGSSKVKIVVPVVVLSTALAVALLVSCCHIRRRAQKGTKSSDEVLLKDFKGHGPLLDGGILAGDHYDEQQMHYLSLDTIVTATNGFSDENKLGEGGFGPVYKGKLPNGMVVAIKRLSKKSTQGLTEFKNEVILIIKLQHRNLVKLLGYCVEEEEKLLVYEYMPNKSLDAFLFDPLKSRELDWEKRMKVIHGTSKGLQYLHEDSRLKIIHRDLKASNILLDAEMNPKISDFGTAKIFEYKQMEDSTERIIGTFGYMSPEYALSGMISEKSDIYSFGILLLEILSCKKASRFNHNKHQSNLVLYAWESWCETKGLNLIDEALGDQYCPSEAIRCVHIALLCIQDLVTDRPTISQVVHMLNNDKELPFVKQPTFSIMTTLKSNHQSSSDHGHSIYEATHSTLEGR